MDQKLSENRVKIEYFKIFSMYLSKKILTRFKTGDSQAILAHKYYIYNHVYCITEVLEGDRLLYLKMSQKLFQNKDKKGYFRIFLQ